MEYFSLPKCRLRLSLALSQIRWTVNK
jgi:hypothetical protein